MSKLKMACIGLTGIILISCSQRKEKIKDIFSDNFYIGAAINQEQAIGKDEKALEIIKEHFNSITSENDMKWEKIHPLPNLYNFAPADSFVSLGERFNMATIGHVLVWHQQTPEWVFEDSAGNLVSRDTLLQRLREHILTVVGRYKGRVKGWDVVNEAIADEDGSLRKTKWLEIIGEDFVQKAFEYAHEADPDAELYYNDYSLFNKPKRDGAIRLVNDLKAAGVRIDAIGEQGHYHLEYPRISQLDSCINELTQTGLKVVITELDINVLPRPTGDEGADISLNVEMQEKFNPYKDSLPKAVEQEFIRKYVDLFSVFNKYSDKIDRITLWGIQDGQSWLNYWPIEGRTNYPLLFDRDLQPKPVYYEIIKAK